MNSAAKFLSVVALVGASWATGAFMGRESSLPDESDDSVSAASLIEVAEIRSNQGTATESPPERRRRVLESLQSAIENRNPLRRSASLAAAIAQIGPDEIEPAVDIARKQANMGNVAVFGLIFARWSEFDPRAAAGFALSGDLGNKGSRIQSEALRQAVAEWARKEPAAATAWTMALPPRKDRRNAGYSLAIGLTESDPPRAFAVLRALSSKSERLSPSSVFESWSRRDPLMASQQAVALPPGTERDSAIAAVATGWAKKDPKAAIDWIQHTADPSKREDMASNIIHQLAETDPAAAMAEAAKLQPGEPRNSAILSVIIIAGMRDVDDALRLVRTIPNGRERENTIFYALSQLTYSAPTSAARLASELPEGTRSRGLDFRSFARESPEDAAAYIEKEIPPGRPRREAASRAATAWAEENPRAATEWFEKVGILGKDSEDNPAAAVWASRDPQAALDWIASRPEGLRKTQLLAGAISGVARHDPAQAAGLLESLPKSERLNPTIRVSREWTTHDPAGAVEWAEQITDPTVRDSAVPNVVRVLAESDIEQAVAMIERIPAGKLRDNAIESFIVPATPTAPETAAAWAITIGDEHIQERALSTVFRQWKSVDHSAATRWIEEVPTLSSNTKRAILGN